MKIAVATSGDRIAPLFDSARRVLVFTTDTRVPQIETRLSLDGDDGLARALAVARLGVDTLICGAISREFELLMERHGVRVTSFIAGEVGPVVAAFQTGSLLQGAFHLPGCGPHRHRRRGGRRWRDDNEH